MNLGLILTQIRHATFDESDYDVEADCNHLIAEAQAASYKQIARSHGYPSTGALYREIERTTSPRWAHYNVSFLLETELLAGAW